jgi:hypothetical protein
MRHLKFTYPLVQGRHNNGTPVFNLQTGRPDGLGAVVAKVQGDEIISVRQSRGRDERTKLKRFSQAVFHRSSPQSKLVRRSANFGAFSRMGFLQPSHRTAAALCDIRVKDDAM